LQMFPILLIMGFVKDEIEIIFLKKYILTKNQTQLLGMKI
jgi:hypothetical protein